MIDRPPERVVLAIRRDDPFIQVPLIAPPGLPMARFVREALTELESPWADHLVGQYDAPGSESFVDVSKAEGEANIEPDRVSNDLGGKAVTAIRIGWHFHGPLP